MVFCGLRMTGIDFVVLDVEQAAEVRLGRLPGIGRLMKWMTWALTVGAPEVAGGDAGLPGPTALARQWPGAAP